MQDLELVEPAVEKRFQWLQITSVLLSVLAVGGGVFVSYVAFQYSLDLGLWVSCAALMVALLLIAISGAIHVIISMEEQNRRANTMAQFTMKTTHNLTAIYSVMEEVTSNMQVVTWEMHKTTQDLQGLAQKLDDIALYSRTTAILIHNQRGQAASDAQPQIRANNGNRPALEQE